MMNVQYGKTYSESASQLDSNEAASTYKAAGSLEKFFPNLHDDKALSKFTMFRMARGVIEKRENGGLDASLCMTELFAVEEGRQLHRYPPDLGPAVCVRSENDRVYIGANTIKQASSARYGNFGYDHKVLGNYSINPSTQEIQYQSEGEFSIPMLANSDFGAYAEYYQLANGKFMVPQASAKGCTYACAAMLLLDQGCLEANETNVNLVLRDHNGHAFNSSREFDELIQELHEISSRAPIRYEHVAICETDLEGRKQVIESLKENLDRYGSCIFDTGGHVVMIDKIEGNILDGTFSATVRDPYHGMHVEIKDPDFIFTSSAPQLEPDDPRILKLDAIFLSKKEEGAPLELD
jgi:hypothetical protein